MKYFFSCDWGTSVFRLRLVNAADAKVMSAIRTDFGIAAAFEAWKKRNHDQGSRELFYQAYLLEQVKKIISSSYNDHYNAPVVLSGMASSNIGMVELPYKELPCRCNGSDLFIHTIEEQDASPVIIISGVRSADDVVRGEETMLVGCDVSHEEKRQLFIFPGTHSKHITVKNGTVQNVLTYMTGEIFDLLSKKSILAAAVTKEGTGNDMHDEHFRRGVKEGASSNLLNCIFHVRTNSLFKKSTSSENYRYLSGLLIGSEIRSLAENKASLITLVSSGELKEAYMQAFDVLEYSNALNYKNADEALIKGQRKIIQQLGYLKEID